MDDDDELMAALFDGVDETSVEDRIKEMVFDQKKIVTSKILGRKLKTQLDVARQHLEKFYETHRVGQNKRNVYAIYYLSGVVDKKGVEVYKAGLVREKNLDAAKDTLTRVESCHVFSLQCSDIKDIMSALMADSLEDDGKTIANVALISCINGHRRESLDDLTQDEPTLPNPPSNSTSSKYFQASPVKEKPKESMATTKSKESIFTKSKSISTKPKDIPKEVQSKKQPSPAKSKEPPKETASKKPSVETEKTKPNDKKRSATNSKDSTTASKKQATLTNFFKKS